MKRGPKHGNILGIRLDSTERGKLLEEIKLKLREREKFYIVTPNPEIVLKATSDWLLKKTILRSTFSIPDGVGLKFAYKFLHNEKVNIIKGRDLFYDILDLANNSSLRVFFVGGERSESEKSIEILSKIYKNIKFKTYKTPQYMQNGQPEGEENRKKHKMLISAIKMFDPDIIFVGLGAPKQEKWIYRNFFRLNAIGAMAVGGTFRYYAKEMKFPPMWIDKLGLEWLWRLIQEPQRLGRIWRAVVIFPIRIIKAKLLRERYKA